MDRDVKKDLSSRDVCEILKSCAEHQITSLQWGGLKVLRGHQTPHEENPSPSGETAPPPSQEQIDTQAKDDLEKEELDFMEDKTADLLIEDPSKFEELVMDGELEDESDEQPED